MKKKAVILLSGGLDSATTLVMALSQGYECYALSFRYGQRSLIESACAASLCAKHGVAEHRLFDLDIGQFKHSALTDHAMNVPHEITNSIPITYVPARNTIFLSIALGWAEVLGARDIFIGANVEDYSGYPDCRPEFIAAFQEMANLGTKAGVEGDRFTIHTPLMHLKKSEIIQAGVALGLDYGMTCSCYDCDMDQLACGLCNSCEIRSKGFKEAGIPDPTRYKS